MMSTPCMLAMSAGENASKDPRLVGLLPSWLTTIINLLIPGLGKLFPCMAGQSAADIKDHLEAAHGEGMTYAEHVTGPTWHEARRLARKDGNPITILQARGIAENTLETARIADSAVLQEAIDTYKA